jgi:Ni/Fe-hydrogenase subunit HybB-like protein
MVVHVAGHTIPLTGATAREALDVVGRMVRAEIASQPRTLRRWFAVLTVLLAIGGVAAALSLPPGGKAFGTTPPVEWGLLIASYVFFVVTTSGLCLVSSLGMVFGIDRFKPVEMRHVVLALLFLVTGFGVIALELHYPLRLIFGVVLSPAPSSPMWWMGTVYGIYLGVLVFELLANLSTHPRLAHAACIVSSGMAVVAPSMLGLVFANLVSRPFWQGSLVPLYLVLTALLSGASVLGIAFVLVGRFSLPGHGAEAAGVVGGIARLLVILLATVIGYTVLRTAAAMVIGSPGERAAAEALVVGPLGLQSWVVRVAIGLVAPLAILLWPRRREGAAVLLASVLTLIGLFVDRVSFVAAGQIAPATAASGIVAEPYASYVPSPDEIGIIVGALALVILLYTLAERFLDLSSPGGKGDVHGIRASGRRSILRRPLALAAGQAPAIAGSPR